MAKSNHTQQIAKKPAYNTFSQVSTDKEIIPSPPTATKTRAPQPSYVLTPTLHWLLIGVGAMLALIPILTYYQTVWVSAFNYPFEDDFNSPLQFINQYIDASLPDRLKLIASQHNEHRIVFDRLVFLGQYYATGKIDFRSLILVGNLSLLLLAGVFSQTTYQSLPAPYRVLYFVPVCYVLFTLHFWELTLWGMASLQNLYVMVFVAGSLYLLTKSVGRPAAFWWSVALAVLATYTSGNGLFVFAVGVPVLLFLRQQRQLLIWLGVGIVATLLYFWGYKSPEAHPNVYDSLVNNTGRAVDYFFTLSGSVFSAKPGHPARAGKLMLMLCVGLVTYLTSTKRVGTYLPQLAILLFLYTTCLVLTATRSGFGVAQAFSPRYGIISVMLMIGLGTLAVDVVRHRWLKPALGIAFALTSFYIYSTSQEANRVKVADRTRVLQMAAAFYNDNPKNLLVYWGSLQELGKTILDDCFRKKTYQIPATTLGDLASKPVSAAATPLQPTNDVLAEATPVNIPGYVVFWNTWAAVSGIKAHNISTEVIAQSTSQTYSFATTKQLRYDVANKLQSTDQIETGFSAVIREADLKPGRYALWLHLTDKKTDSYLPLTQVITVN